MQIDMDAWQGRDDTVQEGADALRWHQEIRAFGADAPPGVVVLGFACDEGVRRNHGRPGAARAPQVLRRALANLAWHGAGSLRDAGDVACDDGDLAAAQVRLAARVAALIKAGHWPLVLGGGHETAVGSFGGLAAAYPQARIGIVNLDAHFDLRRGPASSGTPFAQIADLREAAGLPFDYFCLGVAEPSNTRALFETARQLGVAWCTDEQLGSAHLPAVLARLADFMARVDHVYLTIDLDVLPAAVMPAVSAPAGRGVPLETLEVLIDAVIASGKVALADLVEFNPEYDTDAHGARCAARLAWRLARR